MSYLSQASQNARKENGSIFSKLNNKKIVSASALSAVVSYVIHVFWHLVLFENAYEAVLPTSSKQQKENFFFSMIALLIQSALMVFVYSLVKLIGRSSVPLASLQHWVVPMFAFYHWSSHVLSVVGAGASAFSNNEMIMLFILLESCCEVVKFVGCGMVVVFGT
jgi:hypothetical protein